MTRKIFVKNSVVLSVAHVGSVESEEYATHPGSDYSVLVEDDSIDVQPGYTHEAAGEREIGVFLPPPIAREIPVAATAPAKVGPVAFKLLFTGPERVAIRTARASDPLIDDFFDIVDDPRLDFVDLGLPSTAQSLNYLASKGLIAPARVGDILSAKAV